MKYEGLENGICTFSALTWLTSMHFGKTRVNNAKDAPDVKN
jgi:hypothetical protein